jgi:hypothetical protein
MKLFIAILLIVVVYGGYTYIKPTLEESETLSNITIENNEVAVNLDDYQAKFLEREPFRETHMLFGAEYFKEKNLINPITLFGLDIESAKSIYKKYPDFHKCSSAGASVAQSKTQNLSIIPATNKVLEDLKEVVEKQKVNFEKGLDRVCVNIIGKGLSMDSAKTFEGNFDLKDSLPKQDYILVEMVEIIECVFVLSE